MVGDLKDTIISGYKFYRFLETLNLAGSNFSDFKILLDINNQRLLLVQDGLEIPI